jgi:hypothetical protein
VQRRVTHNRREELVGLMLHEALAVLRGRGGVEGRPVEVQVQEP